jgi:gas vesicle protein
MGNTPEELNTEIAGTREALATDLDALQDRVSPQAIIDRRKAAVRTRAQELRDRVMGSSDASTGESGAGGGALDVAQHKIDGSPIAAGMTAFFAGMIVSALLPATETESRLSKKAMEAAQEHGRPIADSVRSAGQDLAAELKGSGQQAVQEIKDSTQESAQRVRDEGQESAQDVPTQMQR